MKTEALEQHVLGQVASSYRDRGYAVSLHPATRELPEFLSGFEPDLVARGPEESVVVELKIGTETSAAERYRNIAERINRQPGWRFSLVFVNPEHPDEPWESELPPAAKLRARAEKAVELLGSGESETAFLLFGSVAEGALRLLSRRHDLAVENLPPSALIRELYSSGELSWEHFDALRELLPVCNKLAHGFDLDVNVGAGAARLQSLVGELLNEIP